MVIHIIFLLEVMVIFFLKCSSINKRVKTIYPSSNSKIYQVQTNLYPEDPNLNLEIQIDVLKNSRKLLYAASIAMHCNTKPFLTSTRRL